MLQAEFWTIRLGELASVQPATSETLWEALSTQIEQRLLSGVALYFPELGLWKIQEHREYIARTSEGKLWLIPPRLSLSIQQERTTTSVSIQLLAEALSETTHVPSDIVGKWLRGISQLWSELLQQGAPISWGGLGDFSPLEEGQLSGYRFLPSAELVAALNRPFSMFAPVEVSSTASLQDLEILDIEHLDDLNEVEPIEVRWASGPSADLQPAPASSPASPAAPVSSPSTPPQEEPSPQIDEPEVDPSEPEKPEEQVLVSSPVPEEETIDVPAADPLGDPFRDEEERPRLLVWLFVSIGIAIASCLFFFLLSLKSDGVERSRPLPPPTQSVAPASQQAPAVTDSTSTQDSLGVEALDSSTSEHQLAPASEDKHTTPQNKGAEQVRLRPGDRLSRLALKKYGHKAFWVYIYEENRARLKDPDNIPVGAVITLPAAAKYQIDATDTNSVNRALLLQRSLHR